MTSRKRTGGAGGGSGAGRSADASFDRLSPSSPFSLRGQTLASASASGSPFNNARSPAAAKSAGAVPLDEQQPGWKKGGKAPKMMTLEDALQTRDQHTPEMFRSLVLSGHPPQCTVNVENESILGALESLYFEGVEWGTVAVCFDMARKKRGRVNGAVVHQPTRRLFLAGPGLPQWGVSLQLLKPGFRQLVYRLEDTFRKSGVPFNGNAAGIPSFDVSVAALLRKKVAKPVFDLPRCPHGTEAILQFIKKYAVSRASIAPDQLKRYRDYLAKEGVGIDSDGRQWFTSDGRKGAVPWIDIGDLGMDGAPLTPADTDSTDPRTPAQSASSSCAGRKGTPKADPQTRRGRKQPSFGRPGERPGSRPTTPPPDLGHRSGSGASPQRAGHVHTPRTASSSAPPAAATAVEPRKPPPAVLSATNRQPAKNEHHDVRDLAEDATVDCPAALVAPCVIHIPEGQLVEVEQDRREGIKVCAARGQERLSTHTHTHTAAAHHAPRGWQDSLSRCVSRRYVISPN